jgi:hypothetical protein
MSPSPFLSVPRQVLEKFPKANSDMVTLAQVVLSHLITSIAVGYQTSAIN